MAGKKDQLLTLSQAGKRYGYSSDYFRRLAEKGRLSAQKVGHQWLTTADDVKTFLESREQRGVTENARTKIIPRFTIARYRAIQGPAVKCQEGPMLTTAVPRFLGFSVLSRRTYRMFYKM